MPCKDVEREGREAAGECGEARCGDRKHADRDAHARRREQLEEIKLERVGENGELAHNGGDGAGGAKHEERLHAEQSIGHAADRVHEKVFTEADTVTSGLLQMSSECDRAEERRKEKEERTRQRLTRILPGDGKVIAIHCKPRRELLLHGRFELRQLWTMRRAEFAVAVLP